MKLKPIPFSTPMVQAILEGRKTMTRRIIKPQPVEGWMDNTKQFSSDGRMFDRINKKQLFWIEGQNDKEVKPKYQPGDILWVRETWNMGLKNELTPGEFSLPRNDGLPKGEWVWVYKAESKEDMHPDHPEWGKKIWKPSIFMPKEAARIFLKVTHVRAERLQDISEEDAIAEGIEMMEKYPKEAPGVMYYRDYLCKNRFAMGISFKAKQSFQTLWQSINGPGSWEANPWVFVYEFKRVEKPISEQVVQVSDTTAA